MISSVKQLSVEIKIRHKCARDSQPVCNNFKKEEEGVELQPVCFVLTSSCTTPQLITTNQVPAQVSQPIKPGSTTGFGQDDYPVASTRTKWSAGRCWTPEELVSLLIGCGGWEIFCLGHNMCKNKTSANSTSADCKGQS